jgi:hypothetical protein
MKVFLSQVNVIYGMAKSTQVRVTLNERPMKNAQGEEA